MHLAVRRAIAADADALADLYLRARHAASGSIPDLAHTDAETRSWIASRLIPHAETWLAEDAAGTLVGLLVLDGESLDQLYVEPTLTGQGIGGRLLDLAKRERPAGLRLWTFASNVDARRFYEGHGFVESDRTDGANEEGEPDVLYVWQGQDVR